MMQDKHVETLMSTLPPRVLPPREEWIQSGDMDKRIVGLQAAQKDGRVAHTRFAVLTQDMMLFTKHFDDKSVFVRNSLEGIITSNGQALTEKRLRKMFETIDKDSSGCSSLAVRASTKTPNLVLICASAARAWRARTRTDAGPSRRSR